MPVHAPKRVQTEAGLDRLLELEAELGARLRSAREEADRIRNAAEAGVLAGRAQRERAALAEEAVIGRRLIAERESELGRLRTEAALRVAQIGNLDETTVEALASRVLTRLLDSGEGGTAR